MLKNIFLNKKSTVYEDYKFNPESDLLISNLAKINLFIGQNNAGKSRLLREIFSDLNSLEELYSAQDLKMYSLSREDSVAQRMQINVIPKSEFINTLNPELDKLSKHFGNDVIQKQVIKNLKNFSTYLSILDINLFLKELVVYFDSIFEKHSVRNEFIWDEPNDLNLHKEVTSNFVKFIRSLLLPNVLSKATITYIPAFRSIRKYKTLTQYPKHTPHTYQIDELHEIDQPILKTKTILDYFTYFDNGSSYESTKPSFKVRFEQDGVFTGENLYDLIYNLRNSPEEQRQGLNSFEEFLSDTYFHGEKVELNAIQHGVIKDVFVKIGKQKEFPIFLLGDGIQSLIVLTFPLFLNKDTNHLLFIEEPELYLHPGIQRVFLETMNKFPNTQCFIASHSNHFLDLSLEYPDLVSIFSLKKDDPHSILIEQFSEPSTSLLLNLGVRNSSVFLSNCTIWVEGVSDRIFIKKFLEIYSKENPDNLPSFEVFKEDLHYSFVEYSGNNITHWDFSNEKNTKSINAFKISNRIFLIHDNDKSKQQRHEDLKSQLVDNYFPLKCNEIENLLKPNILKEVIKEYSLGSSEITFSEFKYEDYKNEHIGEFIMKVTNGNMKKFISKGGNGKIRKIYNKVEFSNHAVKKLNSWDDLSLQAQELVRTIYSFLSKNN